MSVEPTHATGASITVSVNDEPYSVADNTTVSQLLTQLGWGSTKGMAVAIHEEVVSRSTWETRRLSPGDQVLVIQATQGG